MKKPNLLRSSAMSIPRFVGAIVRSPGGRFLCQLRDRKKGIRFPGYWTCTPGGHVRRGEEPRRAIARELYEEFEIKVKRLRFHRTVVERSPKAAGVYDFFTAETATRVSRVRCHEGRKAVFYFASSILRLRLHPISRRVFRQYLSDLRRGKAASYGWRRGGNNQVQGKPTPLRARRDQDAEKQTAGLIGDFS